MQVMLMSISRKNAFNAQVKDKKALLGEGATMAAIFEEKEVANITPRNYNLIGRDPMLQDSRDPLGATIKSSSEQKVNLERLKFYQESRCDTDFVIYDFAQKALNGFKTRARTLKGNSLAMYKRMLNFINHNVAEFVL